MSLEFLIFFFLISTANWENRNVHPGIASSFLGGNVAPPLMVTYARGDKKLLSKIFMERIVDPILSAQLSDLRKSPGSRHIVMCDGVNDHLDLCKTLEAFGDYEEKHRVLLKLVANATSHTQVCDLLKFFHTIKVPDEVLRTITQQDFDRWVGEMTPFLPRFKGAWTNICSWR